MSVEYYLGDAKVLIEPKSLKRIYVELSRACNLACAMCFRHTYEDHTRALMDEKTVQKMLQEVVNSPAEEVIIGGIGEPLMHPLWKSVVKELKNAYKRVTITTNGTLINREVAEFLVDQRVDEVYISVESSPLGHNNVENTFAVGDLITELKQRKNKMRPILSAEVVLTKSSLVEDLELMKKLSRHGIRYVLINNLLPTAPELDKEVLYVKDRASDLRFKLSSELYARVGVEYPEFCIKTERLCRFVERNSLVIAADGSVCPCYRFLHDGSERVFGREKALHSHGFGNINEDSLMNIWNSSDYTIFRFKVRYALYPSCGDCFLRDGCSFLWDDKADCWGNMPSCGDCLWYRQIILCP